MTGPVDWCAEEYRCPVALSKPVSHYFWFLFGLWELQKAKFPFERNDLTLDEWKDLGVLAEYFDGSKDRQHLREVSTEMIKLMVQAQNRPHR